MSSTPKDISNTWSFRLWIVAVAILTLVSTVLFTAWVVFQASNRGGRLTEDQARAVLTVANFPSTVRTTISQILGAGDGSPYPLLLDRKSIERTHWQRHFPEPDDPGYLLLSGVDPEARQSIVSLIRIMDGKVLARWIPDWSYIVKNSIQSKFTEGISLANARAFHPVLLPDGDIIFNTDAAMARISICSPHPIWILREIVHHSNELDSDGSIWASSVSTDGFADNSWLHDHARDDAIVNISLDGKVLTRRSFVRIMRGNGLQALLVGTHIATPNDDPIHLNQISVASTSTKYWQRGDLLVSAGHLSTIFLYRPSTDKIIWYQTGPWMNQHSVAFLGDHEISVFNNNVYLGAPEDQPFLVAGSINQVIVYDFATNRTTEPYANLLGETKPVTFTEGRAQLLADGGLFIEETNFGRHLRFTRNRLLWSRINDYDEKRIGMVSWSRYLSAKEAEQPLRALATRKCQKHELTPIQ